MEIGDPLQNEYELQSRVNMHWWAENIHLDRYIKCLHLNYNHIDQYCAGLHAICLYHAHELYELDSSRQVMIYPNPWVDIKNAKESSNSDDTPMPLDLTNC